MTAPPPCVFVVDDEVSVRIAVARVLRSAGLTVTTCVSAQEYLVRCDPDVPGCVVLDLAMPGFSGLELQNVLAARGDVPPIIFLTGHADVQESVQAMKHGAVEFLTKPVDDDILIDAVRSALEKDRCDRARRSELAEVRKRFAKLTPRESEVLGYVISGRLNKQIAAELGTVEKTIKVHRAHVMEKLQVASVAELVHVSVRAGIPSMRI
jgi:FixJ family two-component response regulator